MEGEHKLVTSQALYGTTEQRLCASSWPAQLRFSEIGCMAATSECQVNLVAVHTHRIVASQAANGILSMYMYFVLADRLFFVPKLLTFMLAGHQRAHLSHLTVSAYTQQQQQGELHARN